MKTTMKYKKLPPDSGTPEFTHEVHLSGFKNIKIVSREKSERQLADFIKYCQKDTEQPAARMVIGAWGEGKTEAFHRVIKPRADRNQDNAFRIPAKSISNAYPHYKGIDTSEARLLLTAVFHVLYEEGEKIPLYHGGDHEKWIQECLRSLGCEKRKLFVFIDEIEQLLDEIPQLRRLMNGIKQILDGNYKELILGGKFPGSVFIFFACTPEAYNRIATDPDMRQVFGGYGRRMDNIQIETISLTESVNFFYDLMAYSYNGNLPDILPVTSPGIFISLATIARRNIGNMVSLFTRLFSSLDRGDGTIKILDPEELKNFVEGGTITIEGHDTRYFENELFDQIIKKIGEDQNHYKELITYMLFDQRGFCVNDVEKLFVRKGWKGSENLLTHDLRKVLNDFGFPPGLLLFKIINDISREETLFNNLSTYYGEENNENKFKLGEKIFSRSDILDMLSDWSFDKTKKPERNMLLPADIDTIEHLFGPMDSKDSEKLLQIFTDLSSVEDVFYRLPKDFINQIFPPPCPPGLEFMQDASQRFQLWHKASLEYEESLEKDLSRAIVFLSNRKKKQWYFSEKNIEEVGDSPPIISAEFIYRKGADTGKEIYLTTWILSRGRISENDINKCKNIFESSSPPPHLVLFLSNEPVDIHFKEMTNSRFKKRSCFITIHPTYSKQILASYWFIKDNNPIYKDLLERSLNDLLERDLSLYKVLDQWLDEGRKNGLVIDNPAISGTSYKALCDTLRLLLNICERGKIWKEIFRWNWETLRTIIPYGSKGGLVPETHGLETEDGFFRNVGDLERNKFLKLDKDSRIILELSPPENTILEELDVEKSINKKDWDKYFLILAEPESIVEDIYIDSLRQRGLIENKKGKGRGSKENLRAKTNLDKLCEEVLKQAETFFSRIKNIYKEHPDFTSISHIIVAKERDTQIITLNDVTEIINDRIGKIRAIEDPLGKAPIVVFLSRFLEEVAEHVLKKSLKAVNLIKEIKDEICIKSRNYIYQEIPEMTVTINQFLNTPMDISRLREVDEISEFNDELNRTILKNKDDLKDNLKKFVDKMEEEDIREYFWFKNLNDENYSHNYFVFRTENIRKQFESKIQNIDNILSEIKSILQELNEQRDRLYNNMTSRKVEKQKLAQRILESLKLKVDPTNLRYSTPKHTLDIATLEELRDLIKTREDDFKHSIEKIKRAYEEWDKLFNSEKEFLEKFENAEDELKIIKSKFDQKQDLEIVENLIKGINQDYISLVAINIREIDDIFIKENRQKLRDLKEEVEGLKDLIKRGLWEPFLKKRKVLISKVGKQISALKAVKDLPVGFQKSHEEILRKFESESEFEIFLTTPNSCSEILREINELTIEADKILNKYLDDQEKTVFNTIIECLDLPDSKGGIDLDLLESKMPKSSRESIFEVILSLWKKGVLSIRIHKVGE